MRVTKTNDKKNLTSFIKKNVPEFNPNSLQIICGKIEGNKKYKHFGILASSSV